ncbi:hypothetical protein PIB30_046779 [Stylosanthes scabra]|uniref:Uncharacterized protein n=1 Tax=Stylosanthes scabra TaxID=79078 RepID=A0ABU6XHU6_9FABA|nr:hypothetical protein [Stylosanthes scabra]
MDLAHGLKVLKYDRDVITMYEAAENNGGRKKVHASRTPTPKRARGPKRSILVGEGSNHEEDGQEDVCAQPAAKTTGEVNQEPPIYPRSDPNLFS